MPKASISLNVTAKMKEDLRSNKDIETDPEAEMPSYGANNGLTLAMLRGKDYDNALWQDLLDQMTFGEQSYLISNRAIRYGHGRIRLQAGYARGGRTHRLR